MLASILNIFTECLRHTLRHQLALRCLIPVKRYIVLHSPHVFHLIIECNTRVRSLLSIFTHLFEKPIHLLRCLHRREDRSQHSFYCRIECVIDSTPNTFFTFHLYTRIVSGIYMISKDYLQSLISTSYLL